MRRNPHTLGRELFERALALVESCPERCDASCYRCLRSFKNKFEHGLLDRHVGAELLQYLLTGALPPFEPKRLRASTSLLASDLQRQGGLRVDYNDNFRLHGALSAGVGPAILVTRKDGRQFLVALSGPLTTDLPADPAFRDVGSSADKILVILVNELLVRGNLPAATRDAKIKIGDTI